MGKEGMEERQRAGEEKKHTRVQREGAEGTVRKKNGEHLRYQHYRPVLMESEEFKHSSFLQLTHTPTHTPAQTPAQTPAHTPAHTPAPAGSQPCEDVQICITSYREILSPGGRVTNVDQEDAVKQEEPEDENDLCGGTSSPVRHITKNLLKPPVKKEEPDEDDYLSGETSRAETNVTPVDQQAEELANHVKEEAEEDDYPFSGRGISSCVRRVIVVDEHNKDFLKRPVKKEDHEDDNYLCTMDMSLLYGKRKKSEVSLLPADPYESEVDSIRDSDDDNDDQDLVPEQGKRKAELFLENSPPRSSGCPKKRRCKNTLLVVPSDAELSTSTPSKLTVDLPSPHDSVSTVSLPLTSKGERRIWNKKDISSFEVPESVFPTPEKILSPYQYFKMFFTDQMVSHIVEQTNLYSAQHNGSSLSINTTLHEMEEFLSMLLFMGVFAFPTIDDYWHADSRFPTVADTMHVKRFKIIRRWLHFNDNSQTNGSPDRFYKVRPLFDMLREQCLRIPATNAQSVDEVMVTYKGTRAGNLRQYIANRPNRFGFKLFCRASSSGIVHDFLLYQGSTTFFNMTTDDDKNLFGAKVVSTLCKTIKEPESTVVFCDSFFTSYTLVESLKDNLGVRCVGVVCEKHTGGANLESDRDLRNKGCGAYSFCSSNGIIAVKWFDSKCVTLLSNACGVEPLGNVRKFNRESKRKSDVPCPAVISSYNKSMGGVDLSDMLIHLFKSPVKSKRWYLPLFGYVLDLSICNAWLVYKRDCALLGENPLPLKRFRLSVANTLKSVNKPAKLGRPLNVSSGLSNRPRPRPSQPPPDVRYDGYGHWPVYTHQRGRCKLCPKGMSRWKCTKCCGGQVFLCLNNMNNCFAAFHQKDWIQS